MRTWKIDGGKRKNIPLIVLSIFMLMTCQDVPPNSPPEIEEIIVYPSQPKAGQLLTFSALTQDEEGDDITFRWMASTGTFMDSLGANPIQWRAPSDTGTIKIYLHASDAESTTSTSYQFFLEAGTGSVAGHVTDQNSGYLLPGVIVNINGETYTTGSDGYYYFEDVLSGNNIPMSATAENYVTYAQLIDVEVDENIVDVPMTLLTEVGRIAGYVSDSITGEKIAGAVVQTGAIADTTESDGYYELYNVPISENVPVRISHEGYSIFSTLINVVAGYNTNDVQLVPNIATVSGRVTSSDDGNQLEGVVVTINQYSDTTNAAGYYEISNMPVLANASVSAVLDGYVSAYTLIDLSGGVNSLDLALSSNPGVLSGYVVSSVDSSPVPYASIRVGEVVTSSQSDGSFTAGGLDPGTVLVSCTLTNYVSFNTLIPIDAGPNALQIELTPSVGDVSGYLRDSLSHAPLSMQTVYLGTRTTITEDNGYYEFTEVPVNQYIMRITRSGYVAYEERVDIVPGTMTRNIDLIPDTAQLIGIVRNSLTGDVISGAIVRTGTIRDTTGVDGYYELNGVGLGAKQITCSAVYFGQFQDVMEIELGENIMDIDLNPTTGKVQGLLRDAVSDEALGNVVVSIGDSICVSDSTGHYVFNWVSIGDQRIEAHLDGYVAHDEYYLISTGVNIINMDLNPGYARVAGTIRSDQTGQVLGGALIQVADSSCISDSTGHFELTGIAVGTHEITVSLADYAEFSDYVDVSPITTFLEIELSSTLGTLLGYVTDSSTGDPIDSAQVTLVGLDTVFTDSTGFYAFSPLNAAAGLQFSVQMNGYLPANQVIDLLAGTNARNVELSPVP